MTKDRQNGFHSWSSLCLRCLCGLAAAPGREVASLVFCTAVMKSTSYVCWLISWGLRISCTAMEKLSAKSLDNCKMTYNKAWKGYCRSSYYYSPAHSSTREGEKIYKMYLCIWWHVECYTEYTQKNKDSHSSYCSEPNKPFKGEKKKFNP